LEQAGAIHGVAAGIIDRSLLREACCALGIVFNLSRAYFALAGNCSSLCPQLLERTRKNKPENQSRYC
jgi:hypothetical protein